MTDLEEAPEYEPTITRHCAECGKHGTHSRDCPNSEDGHQMDGLEPDEELNFEHN